MTRETIPDLKDFRALALRLNEAASAETLPRFRNKTEVFNKAGIWFDPVTQADREAERAMRRMIRMVFPKHAILGEEFGEEPGDGHHEAGTVSDWRWVLDPIDGTRAFVCGVASWMTLIGLEYKGEPVMGLIEQPFTGESWLGVPGETIYRRNDEAIKCETSDVTSLDRARVTTTDPRAIDGYFDKSEAEVFSQLGRKSRLARFSLDAYAYALLALGELDVVLEAGLARYDYSALIPVVEGAGGVVTNWRGEPMGSDARGEILACATPQLHEETLALIADIREQQGAAT